MEFRIPSREPILLFIIAILIRIPFFSSTPMHIDECNYALSIRNFSLADYTPHAPGYLLFCAAGRVIDLFVNNPLLSLQLLNALSGAVAAVAIFGIAQRFFGDTAGWRAGILAAVSPLGWSYGFGALSYPMSSALASVTIWCAVEALHGRWNLLIPSAILLGLTAGCRVSDGAFISLPFLWATGSAAGLWSAFDDEKKRRLSWIKIAFAFCIPALLAVVWQTLLAIHAGGWTEYGILLKGAQTDATRAMTNLKAYSPAYLSDVLSNFSTFIFSFVLAGGFVHLLLPLAIRRGNPFRNRKRTGLFLLVWAAPAILFFNFVHQGQYGYWLGTIAPPLWIALAAALQNLRGNRLWILALALNTIIVIAGGFSAPSERTSSGHTGIALLDHLADRSLFWLNRYTVAGIRRQDARNNAVFDLLRKNYSPDTTWILCANERWMDWSPTHITLMVPEFAGSVAVLNVGLRPNPLKLEVPAPGRTILLVHRELAILLNQNLPVKPVLKLDRGDWIMEVRASAGSYLRVESGVIEIY